MGWVALAALNLLVMIAIAVKVWQRGGDSTLRETLVDALAHVRDDLLQAADRSERGLRQEFAETARAARGEQSAQMAQFQQTLAAQMTSVATVQNNQIDAFAQQLAKLTETNAAQLDAVRQSLVLNG
ncbi:MAG: DNA recombination protein RmuC, partial [Pandoraea sp.]|nr:DNA recombination protein RmuC [Pandoraea sp.]